jgi:hypothetical protein
VKVYSSTTSTKQIYECHHTGAKSGRRDFLEELSDARRTYHASLSFENRKIRICSAVSVTRPLQSGDQREKKYMFQPLSLLSGHDLTPTNPSASNHAANGQDSQRGLAGCVVSSSPSALWDLSHPTMRPLRSCRPEDLTAVKRTKSPFIHNPLPQLQTSQIISHVS